jgi:hypothetical protein
MQLQKTLIIARIAITKIVSVETPIGNQTGAIQGFGMRKSTSIVVSFGGHLIRMYRER